MSALLQSGHSSPINPMSALRQKRSFTQPWPKTTQPPIPAYRSFWKLKESRIPESPREVLIRNLGAPGRTAYCVPLAHMEISATIDGESEGALASACHHVGKGNVQCLIARLCACHPLRQSRSRRSCLLALLAPKVIRRPPPRATGRCISPIPAVRVTAPRTRSTPPTS